jgi:hypothetical protein
MRWLITLACPFLFLSEAVGETKPGKVAPEPPAVVELVDDDDGTFISRLNNDGGFDQTKVRRDFRDFYSGVCSVRVTPFQRFSSRLAGWNHPIAEKPGPGQYRYIRFAWKRIGGPGIMVQMHNTAGSWNQRYFSGQVSPQVKNWGTMLMVSDKVPTDWVVVTRDLFKDFGPMVLTGFAMTPMEGGSAGLFDHVYLGRTVADLDQVSAAAFGKIAMKEELPEKRLEKLWQDLGSKEVAVAGKALRTLVAGRKDSVPFLAKRLRARPLTADEKHILKLIAQMDDNRFKVRESAAQELEKLGEAAVPFLERATRDSPSLEIRRRAGVLLKGRKLEDDGMTTDQVRLLRGVRILEWAGTAEARQALEKAAGGPLDSAGLTEEVRRALERMGK